MAELPVGGEARGLAGVFGTSINPLAVYMSYAGQRQRNRAAMAAQQKAERDKAMNYLDEFNPSSKFQELNYRVADRVRNNVRDWYVGNLEAGNSGPRLVGELKNRQAQELAYVNETDAWKAKLDDLEKTVKEDPIRYKTEEGTGAISAIRDIYKNPDGTLRSDEEIREGIANADALRFDPRLLNTEGVVKKFTSDLPEQSRVLLSKAYESMGYSASQIEDIVKSGLTYEMEKDPRTGELRPALDDDMMPKVVVDEKLYRLAKADPYMNSLMNAASQDKGGQMQWLKENVRGAGDKVSIDRQRAAGQKLDDEFKRFSFGGSSFRTPIADLQERDKILTQISLGGPTGNTMLGYFDDPMSDIKASYSNVDDNKKKGQFVKVDYVSNAGQDIPPLDPKMTYVEQQARKELLSSRKVVKSSYYDITTQEGRDKLKIALSAEMDRMNKTKAIAEEYPRFIEASRTSKNKAKAPAGNKGGKPNFDNAGLN